MKPVCLEISEIRRRWRPEVIENCLLMLTSEIKWNSDMIVLEGRGRGGSMVREARR